MPVPGPTLRQLGCIEEAIYNGPQACYILLWNASVVPGDALEFTYCMGRSYGWGLLGME